MGVDASEGAQAKDEGWTDVDPWAPTDGRTCGRNDAWTGGRTDAWADGRMDAQAARARGANGRTEGWTDGQKHGRTDTVARRG